MSERITLLTALGAAPAPIDLIEVVDVSDTTMAASGTNKKLLISELFTNPRITTGLLDVNGNPMIAFSPTASGVNGFTFINAATGNPPTIAATGSDSNIRLALLAKGTAPVFIQPSAASAVGLRIDPASSQTANLVEITSDGTNIRFRLDEVGRLGSRGADFGNGAQSSGISYDQVNFMGTLAVQAGGSGGFIRASANSVIGFNSSDDSPNSTAIDTSISRISAGTLALGTGAAGSREGWFQWAGQARMTADATKTDTTFASLADLTISNLQAGRKYTGRMVIKCNNTQSTEGIKFDFNGGTATITSFWASVGSLATGGVTPGTQISTSLAGVLNFSVLTGETILIFEFSFVVNSVAGGTTIIPRFAENSTITGTVTVELGSHICLNDSPN